MGKCSLIIGVISSLIPNNLLNYWDAASYYPGSKKLIMANTASVSVYFMSVRTLGRVILSFCKNFNTFGSVSPYEGKGFYSELCRKTKPVVFDPV